MRAVWIPIPIGWQDAPRVTALARALRRRDPRILLIDLWDWCKRHGREHGGMDAADSIERGAGWRGKRGAFVAACVETGWIEQLEDGYRVREWTEVLSIDWSTATVSDGGDDLAKESSQERRRRLDRERKAKLREAQRNKVIPASGEPAEEAETSADVRTSSAPRPQMSASVSAPSPHDVRTVSASEADVSAANARARTKTKTHTETKTESDLPASGEAGAASAPVLSLVEPEASSKAKPAGRRRAKSDAPDSACVADEERWLATALPMLGLTRETFGQWDREDLVRFRRCRKARGIDQLMQSLNGIARLPDRERDWHTRSVGHLLMEDAIRAGLAAVNRAAGPPPSTQLPTALRNRQVRADLPVGEVTL